MLEDPFYALDEIFRFSAASHAQFLNLIDSKLQESATERNWSNLDVTHIHYLLRLLEEHAEHLRQTHSIITSRDGLGWPKPTDHNLRQKHALLATDLARDFEFLIHRSQVLTAMCNRQIQILLSAVALNESKNAIAQTEAMRKLALLAFIFLPLIFTSAFFSTNLGSFNDPQSSPGIWIWFVVSVPLVILVFFTMTWKENPMERVFAKFVLRKRKAAKGFGDLHGT
jgi:Mg2+ and Co2+ transporter CorA